MRIFAVLTLASLVVTVAPSALAQEEESPPAPAPAPATPPLLPTDPTPDRGAQVVPPSAPAESTQPPAGTSAAPTGGAAPAPFAWGDFTWMNGQSRQKDFPLKAFNDAVTLSLYLDVNYAFSANTPRDNTFTGSASVPRHNEVGINLASVGFEWNYKNVIGRFSAQYGNMLNIVQDLDGTVSKGRSLTAQNLRYIREATAGYHFDVGSGLNVEAGIFMSYIGLESYLLAENWNYQRSIVCDHTPFYFQGLRVQYFPSPKVKIEPWIMNGWQTYGKWNYAPSGGMALRWSPAEEVSLLANFYLGTDSRGVSDRIRFHHDDSILVRYFNQPASSFISKGAFSLNTHLGFETGGSLNGQDLPGPGDAHMVGTSLVNRFWFAKDKLAFALRGEVFSNPSRYLAQYPPPGFATGPGSGEALKMWGLTGTFDVMPTDFITFRFEGSYRRSNLPYFAGRGGTTSPDGYQPIPDATAGYTPDGSTEQAVVLTAVNFRL